MTLKPEKTSGLNGTQTDDYFDTGSVLYSIMSSYLLSTVQTYSLAKSKLERQKNISFFLFQLVKCRSGACFQLLVHLYQLSIADVPSDFNRFDLRICMRACEIVCINLRRLQGSRYFMCTGKSVVSKEQQIPFSGQRTRYPISDEKISALYHISDQNDLKALLFSIASYEANKILQGSHHPPFPAHGSSVLVVVFK